MIMNLSIGAKKEALETLWRRGMSGKALLRHHSDLVDEFIRRCFANARHTCGAETEEAVALVALGGYGRRELFPYSDIDLMILYRSDHEEKIAAVADEILYPLWDSGAEVGHGVRNVEQALTLAGEDFYFRVALLDARLIAGSWDLFDELSQACRRRYVEGHRMEFMEIMEHVRQQRRQKFGAHSYLLEPHVKEGKGGLRDIQAMLWIAKVVYGLEGIDGIVDAGLLSEQERNDFVASWDMLIKIRNRLHYTSGRKNDQLYFEQQQEIAEALVYDGRNGALGVEVFMQEMYGHMQNIAVVTDLFFAHVGEVLGIRWANRGPRDRRVEKGIELRNNSIHLIASFAELRGKPHLLIRLFLASMRLGAPVHHRSRKAVAANLNFIDGKVRRSARSAKSFLAILGGGSGVAEVLGAMLETGVLVAYIPEFKNILTLAQYDVYHIYTVDRHSLQAVEELGIVMSEKTVVAGMVDSPRVLLLAALLHDIGKGSGGDHGEVGAEMARGIGLRMGLNENECDDLSFVIRHHLYIVENALRRDLDDSDYIRRCAEFVGTGSRLAMLYLLSIADSRATGPSAWSDWKGALLEELFLKIKPYLELSFHEPSHAGLVESQVEQGVAWLREQVAERLAGEEGLRISLGELSPDYLLSFAPEIVARHMLVHRDRYHLLRQRSLVFAEKRKDQWSLLIMAFDHPGLLAKIFGVMTLNNLMVLNARIFTWGDGTAVDVLDVRPLDGTDFAEQDWTALNQELDRAMDHRLGLSQRLYRKLGAARTRQRDLPGASKPRVEVNNEVSTEYTVVEVHGGGGEGRLYRVTQVLADSGVNIHKAFISTEVKQQVDVFYVADEQGGKIEDAGIKEKINKRLLAALELKEEN